jgi:group I intron endonuclease
MIYKITNTITDDCYVGYTSLSLEARFKKHYYNHQNVDTYLYRAMRKYGFDNFKIECLQEDGNLHEDEDLWIGKLEPTYNMRPGGTGGDTSSSPNYKKAMENRRSYVGEGNPQYGKHGKDNPKSQAVIVDGVKYDTITIARKMAKRSFSYVKKHGIMVE